jgi:hypothetical protein
VFAAFAVESELVGDMVYEKLEAVTDEAEQEDSQENPQGDPELQDVSDQQPEPAGAAGALPPE